MPGAPIKEGDADISVPEIQRSVNRVFAEASHLYRYVLVVPMDNARREGAQLAGWFAIITFCVSI